MCISAKPALPYFPMDKHVYSVKQLTTELSNLLESGYRSIWVEGEISGLATPSSGHLYFSLKEQNSVIRCAYFRNRRNNGTIPPAEGMQVLVSGQISLYSPRGDLQLIVSYLEEAGEGALRRAFELLKRQLSDEGLFDNSHKQPLPRYPKNIGVITSESGAALPDIVTTLQRRYPIGRIILYPTLVQGDEAPKIIADTIRTANLRAETDVLILARGGGSLEDLQAFNDEIVAREIFDSAIPIISGVGHEVDFTIADLVSDFRAATPTAAAQQASPDIAELRKRVIVSTQNLYHSMRRHFQFQQQSLDYLISRIRHPSQQLQLFKRLRAYLAQRLGMTASKKLDKHRYNVGQLSGEIRFHAPSNRVITGRQRLERYARSIADIAVQRIADLQNRSNHLGEKLNLMNPKHTLDRGYAILQNAKKQVIMDPRQTRSGETLTARLSRGDMEVEILPGMDNDA